MYLLDKFREFLTSLRCFWEVSHLVDVPHLVNVSHLVDVSHLLVVYCTSKCLMPLLLFFQLLLIWMVIFLTDTSDDMTGTPNKYSLFTCGKTKLWVILLNFVQNNIHCRLHCVCTTYQIEAYDRYSTIMLENGRNVFINISNCLKLLQLDCLQCVLQCLWNGNLYWNFYYYFSKYVFIKVQCFS